jgi:hypothetical protein
MLEVHRASRKERSLAWLARLWVAVVIIFSVWETVSYTGIAAFMAEWQYDKIGTAYPALNCLIMIAVLSLPLLVIARLQRRAQKEHTDPETAKRHQAYMANLRIRSGLRVAALITACVIVLIGIFMIWLPGDSGPVNALTVTDTPTPPVLGPTELRGKVLYNKIAVLKEDTFLSHASERFAPVVGEGGNQERLRYFIELPSDGRQLAASNKPYRGILRHGGLPGDLEKIYKYAGYTIPDDYFVLFQSKQSMQKTYVNYIVELSVLFVFFVLMQFVFWYRAKRIEKVIAQT